MLVAQQVGCAHLRHLGDAYRSQIFEATSHEDIVAVVFADQLAHPGARTAEWLHRVTLAPCLRELPTHTRRP